MFGVLVTIGTGWVGGQFEKISASECKQIVIERLETVNQKIETNSRDISNLTATVAEMARLNNDLRGDFKALMAELKAKGGRAEIGQ